MHLGMHDVNSRWNGTSVAYETDMCCNSEVNYGYEDFDVNGYEKQIDLPTGLPSGHVDVYSSNVRRYSLPPKSSTLGLYPNPFLSCYTGDASYAHADDYHAVYDPAGMFPTTTTSSVTDMPVAHDSFALEDILAKPWAIGEYDCQSMFNDYYYSPDDAYVEHMQFASNVTQHSHTFYRAFGYEGAMNPCYHIEEDLHEIDTSIRGDMSYYHPSNAIYEQTKASEYGSNYTLEDPSYHWLYDMYVSQENMMPQDTSSGILQQAMGEPDVVFTTDANGKSTPMASAVMVVKAIQGKSCGRILRVLFDSGGSKSMMNRRILPGGATLNPADSRIQMNTIMGTYSPLGTAIMEDMRLPGFDKNRIIAEHEFHVFDAASQYDVVLGGDFLSKVGMNLKYDSMEVEWFGNTIPMVSLHKRDQLVSHVDTYVSQLEVDELGWDLDSYLADPILDAKYEQVDINTVVDEQCSHLTSDQQKDLRALLSRYTKLFDGTLGRYPGEPMHIDIDPNATPVYRRPYPVPHAHLKTFKKELDHLVELGVLSPVKDTEWGLPTFIIPKKDGRVRWVSDMRELNKVIKRTQYTLPIIQDELRKRHGYQFLTKLDISMQYYTFELDDESKKLCTIVTPFGPYCYNRVPMGLCTSPGYAQSRMEEILRDIEEDSVYLDDIGVFTDTWEAHLDALSRTLKVLEDNNFTINPLKCEWAVKETDWLGYWLTPNGLKPWAKKVESIVQMKPPSTATELRTFIGMVTYYRDMWPRRSHILQPLTALAGLPKRAKIQWTAEMDTAFKQMKALIAEDALMAYPNHNKPFEIYTDASDYQLGACIMQKDDKDELRPVAYYSRKLTGAQKNYTTMEKELLAIVMVLKEYRSMLLGAELNIFTDHRNLTFANFNTQRVLRWRCFIEEYSPKLYYLEGKLNVLADAFSRLPRFDSDDIEQKKMDLSGESVLLQDAYHSSHVETELLECLHHHPDMDDYYQSYLNIPNSTIHPLSFKWLQEAQESDEELMNQVNIENSGYHLKKFDSDTQLVCYTKPNEDIVQDWKICLTDDILDETIAWFHEYLGHPGRDRLLLGMNRYHHVNLKNRIADLECDICQQHKVGSRGFGKLPPRDVRAAPWEQVDVDLIGPWKISLHDGRSFEFSALTSIDRVTGLPEIIRIEDKTSFHISKKFEESWLSRYPRPMVCCHDNGGEFNGWEFQFLLSRLGIRDVPTTSRNPASNGIVERMHQTVGNHLRAYVNGSKQVNSLKKARQLVDEALSDAANNIRTNVHTTTGYSPGSLAFRRDMLMNIPLIVDLHAIRDARQVSVDESLRRTNAKRSTYDYQVGQQVLKKKHEWTKLGRRWDGPYNITRVHCNGNVTIQLKPGVTERLNIRRVKPYHTPNIVNINNVTQNNNTMTDQYDDLEDVRPRRRRRDDYNSHTRGLTDGVRNGSYFQT